MPNLNAVSPDGVRLMLDTEAVVQCASPAEVDGDPNGVPVDLYAVL